MIIGIIATKNRSAFLKKALESALNQSVKCDELIVVSDSDEDNFVIDESLCCGKCTFMKNKYEHNYAGNLNSAVDYVVLQSIKNKVSFDSIYLAFLDDDDVWKNNYIEKCKENIVGKPDFVVPSLNYVTANETLSLNVPQSLTCKDFLSKNPHIQGSNTFIKLSTLLKAGCFDEALNSTTDRDFFTRVMMLDPTYKIVADAIVDVDACDSRSRLTNDSIGKKKSLSYFYSKYCALMDDETKKTFFERAQRFTALQEENIKNQLAEYVALPNFDNEREYDGRIVFGFIMSDEKLGRRLIESIRKQNIEETKIIVLANVKTLSNDFKDTLFENDMIVSLDRVREDVTAMPYGDYIVQVLSRAYEIQDIAVARIVLQYYLKRYTIDGDAIWILDDDMLLETVVKNDSGFAIQSLDVKKVTANYQGKTDAVIGSYSGDAPLPTLSTIRCSLLDYVYSQFGDNSGLYRGDVYNHRDYYYDFSDCHINLEAPLKSQAKSIDEIFSGKATSRLLFKNGDYDFETYCRGGNTIIFNRDLLDIPNVSPVFGRLIARRSDYYWVEQAKNAGFRIIGSSYSTHHCKNNVTFDYEKEVEKLIKDILGASFTKAISNFDGTRDDFYSQFTDVFYNRLVRIVDSFYRVSGLLHIIGDEKYQKYFTPESIFRFVDKCVYYVYEPTVKAAYDNISAFTCRYNNQVLANKLLQKIEGDYSLLGVGNEGVVIRRGDVITKFFLHKPLPDNYNNLIKNFDKCEELFPIRIGNEFEKDTISYNASEDFKPYKGGHIEEMVDFLRFIKDNGLVVTNIKKENFLLYQGKLKYIDYGNSIQPSTEELYQRELKRAFILAKFPQLTEAEFRETIQADYLGVDKGLTFGIEAFAHLVEKREKEKIHDSTIINKILLYQPRTLLDYGCGKCKIVNAVSDYVDCYAFDIDNVLVKKRANKKVNVVDNIETFPTKMDMIISNLVFCNVSEKWNQKILMNIRDHLKSGGRCLISICDPFFDCLDNTELRSRGYQGKYENREEYVKKGLYGDKADFHRPFAYYENLFHRFGFEISDIQQTRGVDKDNFSQIGEHLVFDLIKRDYQYLDDCTLLIKVCPMDYKIAETCIRQIIFQLEKGVRFACRKVIVDMGSGDRNRRFSNDNFDGLNAILQKLNIEGLIDEIDYSNVNDKAEYLHWFGKSAKNDYADNGQQLLATLQGFANVSTRYVYQTDIDIRYSMDFGDFEKAFRCFKASRSITGTFGIKLTEVTKESFGYRTEVRCCFLDLVALKKKLPLPNDVLQDAFVLPWHRALDNVLHTNESIRLSNETGYFVHIPNNLKQDENNISLIMESSVSVPITQNGRVNLEDFDLWCQSSKRPLVVFSRGRNVSPTKLLRLIDSLKRQSYQDFSFIYFDDDSKTIEKEYLLALVRYDNWMKRHCIYVSNNRRTGSLCSFERAMRDIVKNKNAIVVNVDGDDCLIDDNALQKIKSAFDEGADVTVGNCFRTDKPMRRYSVSKFKKSWMRDGDNIWLHPKCFRRYLCDYAFDWLKKDGEYIEVCTDYVMMLPIIEHSENPKQINDIIYYFEPSENNVSQKGDYEVKKKATIMEYLFSKAVIEDKKKVIAVIGDAVCAENDDAYTIAFELGKVLVDSGYKVQTGGLGGVMEAAMKGAYSSIRYSKGDTIAVLPSSNEKEANKYADVKLATGLDIMRNGRVVDADAVIVVGGGAGTLSEIAIAWQKFRLIIALNGVEGWSKKMADTKLDSRNRYPEIPDDRIYSATTVNDAITILNEKISLYTRKHTKIRWRKK